MKNRAAILLDKTPSRLPIFNRPYKDGPGLDEICQKATKIPKNPARM
jgi:hypothetical protein